LYDGKKEGVVFMQWLSYLLVLLCPLMMIFCIRGHGKGDKHPEDSDLKKNLDNKVNFLQKENNMLREEIAFLSALVKEES
jgi:hypothetical protein